MKWRHSWLTQGSAAGACVGEGEGRQASCKLVLYFSSGRTACCSAQVVPSCTTPALQKTNVCEGMGRVPSPTYAFYMHVFVIKVTCKPVRYGDVKKIIKKQ